MPDSVIFHEAVATGAFLAAMWVATLASRGGARPIHVIGVVGLLGVVLHWVIVAARGLIYPAIHIGLFLLLATFLGVVLYSKPCSTLYGWLHDKGEAPIGGGGGVEARDREKRNQDSGGSAS